jgi:hypothetical protein
MQEENMLMVTPRETRDTVWATRKKRIPVCSMEKKESRYAACETLQTEMFLLMTAKMFCPWFCCFKM